LGEQSKMVEQTTDQQMEEVFNTGDNEVTLGDLIQAKDTVDTTSDQDTILEAKLRDAGFDPDAERTTTFLPKISREESYEDINELDITAPSAFYDAIKTILLPDAVREGYEPTTEEILEAAMAITGQSAASSVVAGPTKKASEEVLGMGVVPKTLKSKPTPKETKEEVISFRNNDEQIAKWRDANRVSQKQTQIPEVAQAARDLFEDKITSRKFREIVQKYNPIKKITTENFPNLPTNKDITGSLKDAQRQKLLNVDVDIPDGTVVGARLDIPAYERFDTWVVTLHEGGRGAAKAYGQVAVLKGGIEFKSATDTALGIARDRRTIKKGENVLVGKQTIGRMEGKFYNSDPEETYKKAYDIVANPDKYPEWTQVGFNPYRQSQFYNKDTGMPIFDADEVIQVGPLVLAKDVKKPTRQQLRQLKVRVGEIDPETGLDVRKKTTKSVTPFMSEKTEIKIENILDSYNSRENPISAKEVHKQLKEIKTDKAPEGFKINLKQPEYGPTGAGVYEVQNIKTGEIHEIFQDPSRVLNVKEVEKFKLMNKGGMATQMKDVFNMQEDT